MMPDDRGVVVYALHASENGDRWQLGWEAETDRLFILHVPNAASGGAATEYDPQDFLRRDISSPQHRALADLLALAAS